ncbi:hypothetical protein EDC96DRAFT_529223 [Choanephora cucurbitarum]|nr:hypothetical protein EDC96DRAFT_529223 [Choanephora cucurbitarum]
MLYLLFILVNIFSLDWKCLYPVADTITCLSVSFFFLICLVSNYFCRSLRSSRYFFRSHGILTLRHLVVWLTTLLFFFWYNFGKIELLFYNNCFLLYFHMRFSDRLLATANTCEAKIVMKWITSSSSQITKKR